jgi:hypothetical protein
LGTKFALQRVGLQGKRMLMLGGYRPLISEGNLKEEGKLKEGKPGNY